MVWRRICSRTCSCRFFTGNAQQLCPVRCFFATDAFRLKQDVIFWYCGTEHISDRRDTNSCEAKRKKIPALIKERSVIEEKHGFYLFFRTFVIKSVYAFYSWTFANFCVARKNPQKNSLHQNKKTCFYERTFWLCFFYLFYGVCFFEDILCSLKTAKNYFFLLLVLLQLVRNFPLQPKQC